MFDSSGAHWTGKCSAYHLHGVSQSVFFYPSTLILQSKTFIASYIPSLHLADCSHERGVALCVHYPGPGRVCVQSSALNHPSVNC